MPFVSIDALDVTPLLDRRTLADAVYEDLRSRLMAGMLAPGERLSLREISGALGVSVMPVREAVNRLVAERALEVTPSRTLRVPLSSPSQVRDLADIRGRIEGFAAERAALNRTPAQLEAIEAAEGDMRAALESREGDPARWVALNQAFHFAIYEAAGMPLLLKIIGDLWLKAGPTLKPGHPRRFGPAVERRRRTVPCRRDGRHPQGRRRGGACRHPARHRQRRAVRHRPRGLPQGLSACRPAVFGCRISRRLKAGMRRWTWNLGGCACWSRPGRLA